MNKKQVLLERNNLSRLLGTQIQDDSFEMNIFLLESLNRQKDIFEAVTKACELIKARQEEALALKDIRYEICALIEALDKSQKAFSKELRVIVDNFPEQISEVKISNIEDFKQDHPKEIRVSNLKEIKIEKFPEQVSLRKPSWYKEFDFQRLSTLFKHSSAGLFKQAKTFIFKVFVKNTQPEEAIPVRLVTEDGERFYRAGNVFVGGGGDSTLLAEVRKLVGFEIPAYDHIDLTYVSSGNGQGEIETVTYKKGGATVAVLTLTYNADDEIATITRT